MRKRLHEIIIVYSAGDNIVLTGPASRALHRDIMGALRLASLQG